MVRSLGKWIGRILLALVVGVVALWLFGPRERVDTRIDFDTPLTADTVAAHFAAAEARFDDIVPGVQKRVVWAGDPGTRTPVTVLYLHGYSATSQEIRPVPDRVAQTLGANLVFNRLTGHGRDGDALASATAGDWIEDVAEALAAARAVGDRTLVIATSTGGTLAALAAVRPDLAGQIDGVVFVSPNFGIANPASALLTMPGVRWWGPVVAGAERVFEPLNDGHATYWTETYPTVALLPMAALVKHTVALDFSTAEAPALFLFSDDDRVVVPGQTHAVAAAWGGPVDLAVQDVPDGNDPYRHVIAGDILSPGMTAPFVDQIVAWARNAGF